jgi:UDP-2,3-diacylglucosamine hydrolase
MSAPREADGPIALICGAGTLPLAVADHLTARGHAVLLLPLQGVANEDDYRNRPHTFIRAVQLLPLKRALRNADCRDVVLIGSMVRPAFWRMRFDWDSLKLVPRLAAAFRGGDDHLLRGVAKLFEQQGFRLVGAHEVAPEILVPKGTLGRLQPSQADRDDIAFGLAYLHAARQFDVGQAVVVSGRHVLAVEAAEGTDGILSRVAKLRANGRIRSKGGVLVKAPKPQQDRRFDLPSIGPATVEGAAKAGLSGIAVVAKETIMAEPAALAAAADRAGLFVIGEPVGAVE